MQDPANGGEDSTWPGNGDVPVPEGGDGQDDLDEAVAAGILPSATAPCPGGVVTAEERRRARRSTRRPTACTRTPTPHPREAELWEGRRRHREERRGGDDGHFPPGGRRYARGGDRGNRRALRTAAGYASGDDAYAYTRPPFEVELGDGMTVAAPPAAGDPSYEDPTSGGLRRRPRRGAPRARRSLKDFFRFL